MPVPIWLDPPLLSPGRKAQRAEHLVQRPIPLALHIIETAERSQGHLTHLLLLAALAEPISPCIYLIPNYNSLQTVIIQFLSVIYISSTGLATAKHDGNR